MRVDPSLLPWKILLERLASVYTKSPGCDLTANSILDFVTDNKYYFTVNSFTRVKAGDAPAAEPDLFSFHIDHGF